MAASMNAHGKIFRISVSHEKGTKKKNTDAVTLVKNFGIDGDAHAGSKRQVSLLPFEAFDIIREKYPEIQPGDFAENITTLGFDFTNAAIGDRLRIGDDVRLVITHIGKECHNDCPIKKAVGDCIMPRMGVFASIERGGPVTVGDRIEWDNNHD